ncbi:MAG: nucleotidyl transferase AbiEii/AbiGii toxin family protein [Xanthomonadales bacterium]|nr:nucleotidyl transferase AbiEii/AbiGii toxin family protein [Xanthomonadales bacterium]
MVFERSHHQTIAQLLYALNGSLLRESHCLFGGGTAMAMRFGEYRESVDVDFLVSDAVGYRHLRQLVREHDSLVPLMREAAPPFELLREIRTDQYGIRALVEVASTPIKLEIVLEGRMTLDLPSPDDEVCGIATLSLADMAASKLLANADRGLDDSTFNRDLVDLAMLAPGSSVLRKALVKSETAYGKDIRRDLVKSVERLRSRDGWLELCMQQLAVHLPKATVWQRVRNLMRAVERIEVA